jgi:hypothetical protein
MSMDRKSSPKTAKKNRRRPTWGRIPRTLPLNEGVIKSSWTLSSITSSTAGMISYTASPSFTVNSPEYSVISSVYTEVRLLSFTARLTPIATGLASIVHGAVIIGTNMRMNQATAVNPVAANAVENTSNVVYWNTNSVTICTYPAKVPRNLEFTDIASDAPNPVTPYAGCPGTVLIFGTGLTVSTAFMSIHLSGVFHFRGRT